MKTVIFFSIVALVSSFAVAATEIPPDALKTSLHGARFQATVKDGFHFNYKAPNQITIDGKSLKPKTTAPHEMDFELSSATFTSGRASLYICDDAETICVPNTVELKPGGHAETSPGAGSKGAMAAKAARVTKNKFDFIEDDLHAAVGQAKKQKKLVLIDFSARWCPGCIRLENEIFGTKEFRAATKGFVKVRLDYDRFDNLKIAKQYGIHGIPSLLVTTPALDEISRSVDYQPMATLSAFLKDTQANPLPFAELQKKADAGDKAATLVLGERLYASAQYAKAVDYLSKVEPQPVELRDAKVQAAKEAMKNDDKLKALFQKAAYEAISEEPSSSRSLTWRTDLAESLSDKADKKKTGQDGLAVGDAILAHPEKLDEALKGDPIGEFAGFEKMYVASERADLAEAADLDEAIQQAARMKVVEMGREAHIPVERKGPSLRYLIFLTEAKQYPEAEAQVRSMMKLDPKNPELQRRLLKLLNFEKKYAEAIEVGRETLPESFGKNEVWVAQQLAKAYVGAGKRLEAKALAESYLARTDIDWSMMRAEQKDLSEIK